MAKYTLPGTNTASAAYHSAALLYASSSLNGGLRRGKLYEFIMGATSTPNATNCAIQFAITRVTASGSLAGTSTVPGALDLADSSVTATAGYITLTTEPTLGTDLYNIGLNQQNTQRWQVVDESQMLVWPATAGAGLSGRALSAVYVGTYNMTLAFLE
jgi:hypothetical protein